MGKHYENDFDNAGLKDILMSIINVQNFQVHQFRNYLGGKNSTDILPEWEGEQCNSDINSHYWEIRRETERPPFIRAKGCKSSEFNLCMKIDQSDPSNLYHPVGFAYVPDGAHGTTW